VKLPNRSRFQWNLDRDEDSIPSGTKTYSSTSNSLQRISFLYDVFFVFCGAHQLPTFNIPALEKLSKRNVSCSVTILAVFELAAIIDEESEATIRVPRLFLVVVSIKGVRSELGSTARLAALAIKVAIAKVEIPGRCGCRKDERDERRLHHERPKLNECGY
jgi:hypothetical protein